MQMRVGPFVYRIETVQGYIEHEGNQCLGLCDYDRQILFVSDVGSEAQQVQVLCHEYIEAWLHHFGGNLKDLPEKEQLCDLFGLAMTQFALDFVQAARKAPGLTSPFAAPSAAHAPRRPSNDEALPFDIDSDSQQWRIKIFEPLCPDRPKLAAS